MNTTSQSSDDPFPPVVFVTGAAKRLGRAIALSLAGSGWRGDYRGSAEEAAQTVLECAQSPGDARASM
jgi:NAD(P)-dependent dehydrogenase (short-subunit alcohol dehydrogenase family)